MQDAAMKLRVAFFRTDASAEPVRNWLLELSKADRKTIGEDILAVQFRWPLGMPLVRKMDAGLWEVPQPHILRSHCPRAVHHTQGSYDIAARLHQENTTYAEDGY